MSNSIDTASSRGLFYSIKGGTFAIHDLMSKARYGDMDAFVKKLKEAGYEDVRLIDTADGKFIDKKEARWLDLGGSTLLVGKK